MNKIKIQYYSKIKFKSIFNNNRFKLFNNYQKYFLIIIFYLSSLSILRKHIKIYTLKDLKK